MLPILIVKIRSFFQTDKAILFTCIVIALMFWVVTKLSQNYQTNIDIDINYEIPVGKILLTPPPSGIDATISATGWDLLYRYLYSDAKTIKLTVNDLLEQELSFFQLRTRISKELSPSIEVKNVTPESIRLVLENKAQKLIPLSFKSKLTTVPQHQLIRPPYIKPDSVLVIGPESIVKGIYEWKTETLTLNALKDNVKQPLQVIPYNNSQVQFNPATVDCFVKVEQFTEKSVQVPIQLINASDNIEIIPKKINVSCTVGLSNYQKLTDYYFQFIVDFSAIDTNSNISSLPVQLIQSPEFVKDIRYSPKEITFFIHQKSNQVKDIE